MFIEYKLNFKLPIIGLLFIFKRGEKIHDVIFGEQGTAHNLHDMYDGTSKLEVVLNDSDEKVCDDCNINLNAHSIVALSPERFNLKVLLESIEGQLDLPSVSEMKRFHTMSSCYICEFSQHLAGNKLSIIVDNIHHHYDRASM